MSLQKGLVGHWTMDDSDTSNGTLYDRSARDNHGETRSGITPSVAGRVGEAFSFDGTDGAYVPTQLFYDSTGITAVSVAHWFKSSSSADQITVSSDRNEYWRLGVGSDGVDGVYWTVDSSDMVSSASRSELQDGNWHHIVGTFDGSLTNDHAIYIDGQLDSKANLRNSFGSGNKSYTHIGVGSEASVFDGSQGPNDHVVGEMDDVRVYNRAISASEARALFNMRSQRQQNTNGANVEDLVLYLNARDKRSVDQSNNRWKDISGNGNEAHGTSGDGVVDNNLFPNWEPVNGGRFILNGSEGFNVPGPVETTGKVSLESWFKRTDTSSDIGYLSDARNGSGNWHLTNYRGYNINFGRNLEANDPAGVDYNDSGSTASPDSNFFDKWTHLVATSDGNTSQLFIDGEQITDSRINESNPFQTGIGQDFAIANRFTGSGHLEGFIAVYRIYDRVLSPAQVKANYDSEKRFYE